MALLGREYIAGKAEWGKNSPALVMVAFITLIIEGTPRAPRRRMNIVQSVQNHKKETFIDDDRKKKHNNYLLFRFQRKQVQETSRVRKLR